MNIIEMLEKGKEMGLKEWDVFPYDNPQRLTMNELQSRVRNLPDDDNSFIGGAWSGD